MFHPIIVKKFGERRRGVEFWRKRKVWRRNDTDDKCYSGTTGLWKERVGMRIRERKRRGTLRVGGDAMTLGWVERMRWRARERRRERVESFMAGRRVRVCRP
jgi:hypothetical protein